MRELVKKARKTVRYTGKQAARIERAAKVLSQRKGELVEDSEIIRTGSLRYAEEILASASPAKRAA